MNDRPRGALCLAIYTALAVASAALGDDDDGPPPAAQLSTPALDAEQQRAVALRTMHPVPARAPERADALGVVLDRAALLTDEREVAVAGAQERVASSELARVRELYKYGGAALKVLEVAEADAVKTRADSQLSSLRFAQKWGPVAAQPAEARRKLLEAVTSGHAALVRADLPGRRSVGAVPGSALLDVDGIQIPGRVLGALTQPSELQGAALLIEVLHPPAGLAPGARIPLALLSAERVGLLLPNEALLYGADGAYVYKQIDPKLPKEKVRYLPVKVTPLVPYGDGWLVKGVSADDEIVVHGAGVLWSLEGMGGRPPDDDD